MKTIFQIKMVLEELTIWLFSKKESKFDFWSCQFRR